MGKPAAKKGDQVTGSCMHTVQPPGAPPPPPVQVPHPFVGMINDQLSSDVKIGGQPAAVAGSKAINTPAHIPTPPNLSFITPPNNQATLEGGSQTVKINGKPAIRAGDQATTCDEAKVKGVVVAVGTVMIGD